MKARTVIEPALQRINVGSREQPADAGDMAIALERLNSILLDWSTRPNLAPAPTFVSLALVEGQAAYALGPTGDLTLPRAPADVLDAVLNVDGGPSRGLDIVPYPLVRNGFYPTGPGWPMRLAFVRGTPNALVLITPAPFAYPSLAISLALDLGFPAFADYDTDVPTMPDWYLEALQTNLAVSLAPDFSRPVPSEVARAAARSLRTITAQQSRTVLPYPEIDPAVPGQRIV